MACATIKQTFLDSLNRCGDDGRFVAEFYRRFMAGSDEVQAKFRLTNLERQSTMLLRSLQLVAGATSGEPRALQEMRERAETHCRDRLDISPPLYEHWLDALMATAAEFDPNWDDSIEAAWSTELRHVIEHMVRYY